MNTNDTRMVVPRSRRTAADMMASCIRAGFTPRTHRKTKEHFLVLPGVPAIPTDNLDNLFFEVQEALYDHDGMTTASRYLLTDLSTHSGLTIRRHGEVVELQAAGRRSTYGTVHVSYDFEAEAVVRLWLAVNGY